MLEQGLQNQVKSSFYLIFLKKLLFFSQLILQMDLESFFMLYTDI